MKTFGHWLTSPWRRSGIAALAGALPVFTFPAPSLWWFAYVALVPWIALVRSAPTGNSASTRRNVSRGIRMTTASPAARAPTRRSVSV